MRDPENLYLSRFDSPATRHITNFLYTISNDRVLIRPNLITSLFVLETFIQFILSAHHPSPYDCRFHSPPHRNTPAAEAKCPGPPERRVEDTL